MVSPARCPYCGAPVKFNAQTSKVECEFCGREVPQAPEEHEPLEAEFYQPDPPPAYSGDVLDEPVKPEIVEPLKPASSAAPEPAIPVIPEIPKIAAEGSKVIRWVIIGVVAAIILCSACMVGFALLFARAVH